MSDEQRAIQTLEEEKNHLLDKVSEKNSNSRDETEVEIELCPEKTDA